MTLWLRAFSEFWRGAWPPARSAAIRRAASWWMGGSLVATVVSGIVLSFAYTAHVDYIYAPSPLWSDRIRLAHKLSVLSFLLALACTLTVVLVRRPLVRRARAAATGWCLVIFAATSFAFVSGSRLAWEAMGFRVLNTDSPYSKAGVWTAAFDHNVWWVIAAGRDEPHRYASYLIAHLLVAAGIAFSTAAVVALVRRTKEG